MNHFTKVFVLMLLFSGIALAQPCNYMPAAPVQWANDWAQVAFVALLMAYLFVGLKYMIAYSLNLQWMFASAKRDLMYIAFISVLLGVLYSYNTIMNTTIFPMFATQSFLNASTTRTDVSFCSYGPLANWADLQTHAVQYNMCLRDKCTTYFEALMNMNFILGFVSSITLVITPLELIGLSFTPGAALKPMIDTMGYGLYMLALTIAQLKAQEVFLCFSMRYMFTMVLPVGVALSAFPFTRSAGGTLISIAIGFYIVLPLTFLISEEIVYDYCRLHNGCNISDSAVAIMAKFMGTGRDIAEDMFEAGGAGQSNLADIFSLDGPMGPIMYIMGIAATLLPLCSLIATLMFIKSFARLFGAEADFSAMIKLL